MAAPAPQTERVTQAELVSLSTGPRERSAEELDRSKLGGGLWSYGSGRDDSRWGSSRVSKNGERRVGDGFNRHRDSDPSRADETNDWAVVKKPILGNVFERRERDGGFFESQSQSKVYEVDSWVSTKPLEPRRFVSTNGGAGGHRFERKGSFESLSRNRDSQYGGRSDSDSWGRRREETAGAPPPSNDGSQQRLVLQPRTLPFAAVVEVKPESPVRVIFIVSGQSIKDEGVVNDGKAENRDLKSSREGADPKDEFYDVERSDVQDGSSSDGTSVSGIPVAGDAISQVSTCPWKEELEVLIRGGVPMALRGSYG